MSLSHAVFFALAAVTMASAVMAITRRNVVHSAVFLIITLLAVGGLYLQLEAEFLFAVQVILYVGGIMVLFLFVIMLVNLEEAQKEAQFKRFWWIAVVAVLVLSAEWGYVLFRGQETFEFGPQQVVVELAGSIEETAPVGNTEQIGIVLFRNYMLPFEIASLLLLVAMVGAVVMAKRRLE